MEPESPVEPAGPEESAASALSREIPEIIEYLSCYLSAQLDRSKLGVKELLWKVTLGGCAVFVMIGALLLAVGFTFYGLSLGLAELLEGRLWAGFLCVGTAFLALSLGLLCLIRARSGKHALKEKVQDYERTLEEQRSRFGHSLEDLERTAPQ